MKKFSNALAETATVIWMLLCVIPGAYGIAMMATNGWYCPLANPIAAPNELTVAACQTHCDALGSGCAALQHDSASGSCVLSATPCATWQAIYTVNSKDTYAGRACSSMVGTNSQLALTYGSVGPWNLSTYQYSGWPTAGNTAVTRCTIPGQIPVDGAIPYSTCQADTTWSPASACTSIPGYYCVNEHCPAGSVHTYDDALSGHTTQSCADLCTSNASCTDFETWPPSQSCFLSSTPCTAAEFANGSYPVQPTWHCSKVCPAFAPPANALTVSITYPVALPAGQPIVGTVATVQCNAGAIMTGNGTVSCLGTGFWSTLPTCDVPTTSSITTPTTSSTSTFTSTITSTSTTTTTTITTMTTTTTTPTSTTTQTTSTTAVASTVASSTKASTTPTALTITTTSATTTSTTSTFATSTSKATTTSSTTSTATSTLPSTTKTTSSISASSSSTKSSTAILTSTIAVATSKSPAATTTTAIAAMPTSAPGIPTTTQASPKITVAASLPSATTPLTKTTATPSVPAIAATTGSTCCSFDGRIGCKIIRNLGQWNYNRPGVCWPPGTTRHCPDGISDQCVAIP